jgi:glutathione peroxidase-family protein
MARAPWEFLRVINDERRGNLARRAGNARPVRSVHPMKGPNPHASTKLAASERPLETRRWNLHKYLTGRGGHIAAVFATDSEPIDAASSMRS